MRVRTVQADEVAKLSKAPEASRQIGLIIGARDIELALLLAERLVQILKLSGFGFLRRLLGFASAYQPANEREKADCPYSDKSVVCFYPRGSPRSFWQIT